MIVKNIIKIIFIILILSSCKSVEYIDRYNTNTQYINTKDSIYIDNIIKDSIFIYNKGDTVFINKYNYIYKDRFHYKYDTIVKTDSIYLTKKEIVTKTDRKGWYWFVGLLIIIFGYFLIKKRLKFGGIK